MSGVCSPLISSASASLFAVLLLSHKATPSKGNIFMSNILSSEAAKEIFVVQFVSVCQFNLTFQNSFQNARFANLSAVQ
jgi:hypothetical protein